MGSFNTSCFASRQTIAPGAVCYVLPLIQAKGYDPVELEYEGKAEQHYGIAESTCYPSAFWDAYGGFIEARYADYGQFTLVDSPTNRIRLLSFIRSLWERPVKIAAGENSSHDLPFDLHKHVSRKSRLKALLKSESASAEDGVLHNKVFKQLVTTWDYIWEVAQENRLFGIDWEGSARPLQFAVMHGHSFHTLVADVATTTYRKQSLAQTDFFEQSLNDTYEALKKSAASEPDDEEFIAIRFASRLGHQFERIGSFEGLTYPYEMEELGTMVSEFFQGKESEGQLYARLKPTLDARYVFHGLNALNLQLTPMVYASQDYDNTIGSSYANFIARVSTSVTQSRRDNDDE